MTDETWHQLIRRLRGVVSQEAFAEGLGYSRGTIANNENGRDCSKPLRDRLIEKFPAEKLRIEAAYKRSRRDKRRPSPPRRAARARIASLVDSGRFEQAERAIRSALSETDESEEQYWLHERLYVVLRGRGADEDSFEALQAAIASADQAGLRDDEERARARLAGQYQVRGRFTVAHQLLDAGLLRHPSAARLWLRKGKVHWYEQSYAEAYAALTTALRYRSPRRSVLHARGQALAEWGSFDAALEDIDTYLETAAHSSPVDVAHIRTARAYVWAHIGRIDDALTEFHIAATVTPNSGWLHYRRGLSYLDANRLAAAAKDLACSLERRHPALDPVRYQKASDILATLA
jgi:tetratricopeptide (TPR) repeat protein